MKLKWKIALPILALLLLSTLLTTVLSYSATKSTIDEITDNILDGSLDMIISEIARAERTEDVVLREISEKNLALGHSFAELLLLKAQENALDLSDHAFFQSIADMMGIHELNVVNANREIVGSNFDDYYGYVYPADTVYARILANPNYEVTEEPRQDAISGDVMLYFGVARTDAGGFIQLGFDAEAVKDFRQNLDISHVAAGLNVGLTGRASLIQDGVIIYSQKSELIGTDVSAASWYRQMSQGRGKAWAEISGEMMYAGYANIDGLTMLVLLPQAEYNSYLSSVGNIGILGVVIAIGIAVVVLLLLTLILTPVKAITRASQSISNGDFNINLSNKSKDEIGVLAQNFDTMAGTFKQYIEEINLVLAGIAAGDFQNRIERQYVGQFESIRTSINTIETVLNSTMGDISAASNEVLSGSSQIASGAQALASGSTEQAATIEELSATILDITAKTKENASMANTAAELASGILKNAEKGNSQMGHMIEAVNEINQANQNISKVIKAIDDIAFQTNILALNAAVEAARAGAAGKGFAVVAEEVRNLASKSAESAKDTATLISNSMEKAQLGTKIAAETADSLRKIVEEINESNRINSQIAVSCEEQSAAIGQINEAIGEVTQVVQQNSATAEQSAAASEEMSGQAAVLEELVSRFKLKGGR
ncbi:MAG: methyl-accepting chemotaxis protein [Oscillospiraceae bacterium]|nr:methyl-accepting chemotaxis protein [Oscillospiraceae bacterium]